MLYCPKALRRSAGGASQSKTREELYAEALKIFRIVASEFNGIPDGDDESGGILTYFSIFSDLISVSRFGKSYPKALAYLTAHKLKMMGLGVDSDNIGSIAASLRLSSASEGETSVSFSTNQGTNMQPDAEYALTIYGLEFLTLKRNAIIGIVSAGEGCGW